MKYKILFLIFVLGFLSACDNFILDPQLVFKIVLDEEKFAQTGEVHLRLTNFNVNEVATARLALLQVDGIDIQHYTFFRDIQTKEVNIKFNLPNQREKYHRIWVGLENITYKTGVYSHPLPKKK